jgi:hypothetical protein
MQLKNLTDYDRDEALEITSFAALRQAIEKAKGNVQLKAEIKCFVADIDIKQDGSPMGVYRACPKCNKKVSAFRQGFC